VADFRKIAAWQKADEFVLQVYSLTRTFPENERFGLTSQLRRAAVSIPANLAEGAGRQTLRDFRQFLFTARGSLNEVEYYIHLAGRLGYLDVDQGKLLTLVQHEVGSLLQGLIAWTTREIESGRQNL
jgi:four helix bundle protein